MRNITKLMITVLSVAMFTTLLTGAAWADPGKNAKKVPPGQLKKIIQSQYQRSYQPTWNYSVVFKDLGNHWAKNDILRLESLGVMKGYENKQFMPDKHVSKNEAIAIIMRVVDHENIDSDKEALIKQIFPGWMGLAPLQAYDAGILADWELLNWNGDKPATRIEAAMWLSRAAGDEDISLQEILSFKDTKNLKKDELAYAAVMYKRGILRGTPDGYLNPYQPITRAEFAVMITRFIDSAINDSDVDEEKAEDYIRSLRPANKAKVDLDTNEFTIRFTEDMILAEDRELEDLTEAIQLLKYKDGKWVNANLDYAIVFNEQDNKLVIKLDSDEVLAANTRYCITIANDILVTEEDEAAFSGIKKGEWYFTTEAAALEIKEVEATSDTSIVIQFSGVIEKGEDFNSNGRGIHVLKGNYELDIDAVSISGSKLRITLDEDDSLEDGQEYQVWLSKDVINNFSLAKKDAVKFTYED